MTLTWSDHVMERLALTLEAILEGKGFKVLNRGDEGWVHFFTQKPILRPEDLKPLRFFVGTPIFIVLGGSTLLLFFADGIPAASIPVETYRIIVSPLIPTIPLTSWCSSVGCQEAW